MSKKELLHKLHINQRLSAEEAKELMLLMAEGKFSEVEIASIIMFYNYNSISIDELRSFRTILLSKCLRLNIPFDVIDVCGTGGDEKNTFNISTLSALVIAACGYKVAKHGNYGASSVSGSSNILEYFGYKFTNNFKILFEQLEENNICFLHAPLFHPALKHVAPVRKELGTKTFFNLLGPLVNPCNISHQFIGVNSMETLRKYHYLLQNTETEYALVHSLDGYDEISLTGSFKITGKYSEKLIHPNEFNIQVHKPQELFSGKTIKESAEIFINVLQNTATEPQLNAVIVNSAFAIQLITQKNIQHCLEEARESLENRKAFNVFKNLIQLKHEYT